MKHLYRIVASLCFAFVVCQAEPVQAQQLAFPGAEGFGRFTTGGRGGAVIEVTNLNDSGPGSLRAAVTASGPRTIVFKVAGTIHLLTDLRIRNGNLTIAGQTAPGGGICTKGGMVIVDADNVIIRYMRFRPGDISDGEPDALWGRNRKDIIIDHCSMSWAVDEVGSFYDNTNFTMQWCILSESLFESQHNKGRHGYGGIWGGHGATFHHNILAHHSSRNPRFNGSRYTKRPDLELVDHRNNVIYNWINSSMGGEAGSHNMVANYYKFGPATNTGSIRHRIVSPGFTDADPLGKWYIADNFVTGNTTVTTNNWNGGVQGLTASQLEQARALEPFPFAPVHTQTAQEAFLSVLENAGATLPRRDIVDARIMEEVRTGTATFGGVHGAGRGIIDSQETVGGWPELMLETDAPAPLDTDKDGMPDAWELQYGLNPNDPADRNGDNNGDGYTNLEEYLNGRSPNAVPTSLEVRTQKADLEVYPNPFNESVTFSFSVHSPAPVQLEIFDITGKKVATLVNDALQAGHYKVNWSGKSQQGLMLSEGIYLYSLQIGANKLVQKIVLSR